jgi:hypothetical protein
MREHIRLRAGFATHFRPATYFGGRQGNSPGAVAGYFFARFKV